MFREIREWREKNCEDTSFWLSFTVDYSRNLCVLLLHQYLFYLLKRTIIVIAEILQKLEVDYKKLLFPSGGDISSKEMSQGDRNFSANSRVLDGYLLFMIISCCWRFNVWASTSMKIVLSSQYIIARWGSFHFR